MLSNAAFNNTVGPTVRTAVSLEVRGPAAREVYLDSAFRGRIRPNGLLLIEGLSQGTHKLSVDPPGAATLEQNVALNTPQTVLDLQTALPANAASKSSPWSRRFARRWQMASFWNPMAPGRYINIFSVRPRPNLNARRWSLICEPPWKKLANKPRTITSGLPRRHLMQTNCAVPVPPTPR